MRRAVCAALAICLVLPIPSLAQSERSGQPGRQNLPHRTRRAAPEGADTATTPGGGRLPRYAVPRVGSAPQLVSPGMPPPAAPQPAPPSSQPKPQPPAPSPQPQVATLRVLQWNIKHGTGTDERYDLDRLATWMAQMEPDVISLNEVERFNASWGNENQPRIFATLLTQKTGQQWYVHFAQRYGQWSASGQGNAILSRFPFAHTAALRLPCGRSAALAGILHHGRVITVVSTHLDLGDACRTSQVSDLLRWLQDYAEPRIVAGDWNAQPVSTHVETMNETYYDAWAKAAGAGTATDYPGNSRFGATKSTRIDYVFYSRQASALALRSARVFDTRDTGGVMPSDHKPLVASFELR